MAQRTEGGRYTEARLTQVVDIVEEHGPMTTDRVQERSGLSYSSTALCLRIAEKRGLLKRRLAPELRNGNYGRSPCLWAVVE